MMRKFTITDEQQQKIEEWLDEIKPEIIKLYLTKHNHNYVFNIYEVIDDNDPEGLGRVQLQINPITITPWVMPAPLLLLPEPTDRTTARKIGEKVVLGTLKDDPFDTESWYYFSIRPNTCGDVSYNFTPTAIGIGVSVTEETTGLTLDITDYDSW